MGEISKNSDPNVLSYRSAPQPIPPKTQEEWAWLAGRLFYRMAILSVFGIIAFEIGPHLILFGKISWLTPADLIPDVKEKAVPIAIAAMKYQRDHKTPPPGIDDLVPQYLPKRPDGYYYYFNVDRFECLVHNNQAVVTYYYTPGTERWEARGYFTSGIIPLSPLPLPPATSSTSP